MEAVRIREGVETEEEVLTGAAIVERQAGRVRVQLKTDVETVEETEEKPKHYRFTLIELRSNISCETKCWKESAKMLAALVHFMQGTPYIYQGEELGMTNAHFTTIEEYRDVESFNYYQILLENGKSEEEALHILSERSRDNSRTPMQWSAEKNAGFSQAEPKVVWQSEWDSYELLLENYSDGKVDGTLRPYECKMMRSI